MYKILATEAAWFAGLFEGEGSVGVYKGHPTLRLALHSRDADVINRIKEILNCGYINGPYHREDGCSVLYFCIGKLMDIYRVIKLIYPYLGLRRRGQCDVVLQYIENTITYRKLNK